ncbi:Type I restriction-modification methylase [Propionibacterium freudenreichii]|uniref:restriction endonuclease subunit S n=1 Tax=Propionibacterium freudenreichii TaxID=1744 RepID=UPI000BC2D584|nr:restriction endonuclease subunit S [Propionibacterium freudenreichii]SBN96493.1 Type I restriction-modification methylase [Propionibacterium freudenreichii]SCC98078.1 Type I restriction-modification methylase [Propionibacterium freudenreichii]
MSQIEELIERLCPDGVKFMPLGTLGTRNKGTPITAARMKTLAQESGPIRVFAGGSTIADVSEDSIPPKNIIRVPSIIVKSRGYIGFTYYDKPFTHKSELWSYSLTDPRVNQRFIYYYLLTRTENLQATARATSVKIPQLGVKDTDNLRVPVPPLEVQHEIVKILDTFTDLESELESELEARRLQFRFYQEKILLPCDDTPWTTLSDIADIGTGNRNTNEASSTGTYPFFVRSQEPLLSNSYQFDETAIITAGDGVGVGRVFHFVRGKYALHQRAYRISPQSELVEPKFLFYWIRFDFPRYLTTTSVHASVTSLRRPMFLNYRVPLPPLPAQRQIIHILDTFDALVNDLSSGLPAELNARRAQYEYYRDKLLTFKELKS